MTLTKATVIAAAALALGATGARAQTQGILTCQIQLSQFAEDVYRSKAQLRPGQLAAARQLVEIGRSQCRSGPDLVSVNIQSMRKTLALSTGNRAGSRFDSFWPATEQELSLLK